MNVEMEWKNMGWNNCRWTRAWTISATWRPSSYSSKWPSYQNYV